jgi:hypothetical protein
VDKDHRIDTLCTLVSDQAKILAEHSAILNKCISALDKPTRARSKYCHTHGLGSHNSMECYRRGPNHKEEATFRNRLGGSTKGIE